MLILIHLGVALNVAACRGAPPPPPKKQNNEEQHMSSFLFGLFQITPRRVPSKSTRPRPLDPVSSGAPYFPSSLDFRPSGKTISVTLPGPAQKQGTSSDRSLKKGHSCSIRFWMIELQRVKHTATSCFLS